MFDLSWLTTYFSWRKEMLVRGRSYLNKGAVAEVGSMLNANGTVIFAKIKGTKTYRTTITVNKKGAYSDSYCSCPFNRGTEGDICKHIAALYLYLLKNNDNAESMRVTAGRDFLSEIFEVLEMPVKKRNVNIKYVIEYERGWSEISWKLSMRMGFDKLYVVKNVKELLECIMKGDKLEFGKSFTYNSKLHSMTESDKSVFDFLRQLYLTEMSYKAKLYGGSTGIFNGKNLILSDELFIKLSSYLKGKHIDFIIQSNLIEEVKLELEKMPFSIFVRAEDTKIAATINYLPDYKVLGKKDRIILQGDTLYILDNNKKAYEFHSIFKKRGISTMEFFNEERAKFLSLLPQIIGEENINISEEISRSYIRADIKANLYIDRYRKGIMLMLLFDYEGNKINPFEDKAPDPYIIRNFNIENQIIRLIEDSEFKIKESRIYLEDYDRIYIFFRDAIPVLNDLCSIYYTDDVKNLYTGRIKSYKSYVSKTQGNDLVDINIELDDFDPKEIKELLGAIKEKKNYHRLKNGQFVSLEGEDVGRFTELLSFIEKGEIKDNVIQLSKFRALSVFENIRDMEAIGIDNSEEILKMLDRIKNPLLDEVETPNKFKEILRDYQVTGFKWLQILMETGFGGILADDMGLGKTLQTIALIYNNLGNGASIVVTPSSLVYNWENEIRKFAPEIKTLVISGDKAQRQDMINEITGKDVVITSYPLIRRDIENYEGIEFIHCILDEAQHIKNPESLNAATVKKINAKHRFALTGTPMENSLIELWSIFDFLMPGYLMSKGSFSDKFEKNITRGGDNEALSHLRKIISPFILRRKKKDVLSELPDKIETKLICELTEGQRKLYNAYIMKAREELSKKIEDDGFDKSRIQILSMITRLRQICCHPSVFVEDYDGGSGKLEMLEELIEELIEGEHRILLFSQFTSLLEIIRKRLEDKNIKYLYLDGSVPSYKRMSMVDNFNSGEGSVFLISLKAGGTGLNLTSADVVIHFDPWWNPAVEDQASDRAHRIGQENVVEVFKLITKDTIEEKIFELQNKKKDLINSVIQEGENFINKLSEDEIMELFII